MDKLEFNKAFDRCWATANEFRFPPQELNNLINQLLKLRNDGDIVGNSIKTLLIRLMWNRNRP